MLHLLHAAVGVAKLVGRFVAGKRRRHDREPFDWTPWTERWPTAMETRVLDAVIERVEEIRANGDEVPSQARREQALSFAYGNLASSTHHKPDRLAFWLVAQNEGWGRGDFEKWASGREWDV